MGKYITYFENHSDYEAFEDMLRPNVSYCNDNQEVHFNPINTINGHTFVDLDLPSGTLWATKNIGATEETDPGLYFSWGETEGFTDATTKNFSWDDYKWASGGGSSMTKYNSSDGLTTLELEDDAANVNMGDDWRIPSISQAEELLNNTTESFQTNYKNSGVNGLLFTGRNGNTLFIPAGNCYTNGTINQSESFGYLWLNALLTDFTNAAQNLHIDDSGGTVSDSLRYSGYNVRGVIIK